MATAPSVPNFSQYNFELGDTTQVVTKQNGINAALEAFGNGLGAMTQSINQDITTMEGLKGDTESAAQAAAGSASAASTSESNAQGYANAASGSASAAAGSATTASNAANAASTSETNAASSASAASDSADQAASSASAAAGSASAAQTAETGAESALLDFLTRYLGPKGSAPTTDNDGQPLQVGALYLSTANGDEGMRYWDGSQWRNAYATIDGVSWADVSGKPETATRWPTWTEVTNKPALFSGNYKDLAGVPETFTPSAHTHQVSDIDGLQSALDGAGTRAVTHTLTAPPTVRDVATWRIEASATSRHVAGSVAAFEVTWWDGVTETVAASGGSATLSRAVDQPVGGTVSATIRALDDIGNASLPETVTAVVVANDAPSGPISISAPTQTGKNSTFQVSFSGATDADGDPITYTVTDTGTFTFAKTSDIAEGELVDVTAPDVANDTDVTFSVKAVDSLGASTATYSETVTVLAAQVIGVALRATGGPGGTWEHIDEAGAAITSPSTSWFNGHPVFGGISDVTVDGQDMVEIPKFYWKRGTAGGDPAWWISDQPLTGFTVHPAFVLDGVEVDSFQVGKYQASESGGKMQSIPGVAPWVNMTIGTAITNAEARNVSGVAGFRLWHYDMWLAIQWLYLVEVATMDSQTATGEGRVNESSAANVDAADVAQATYRGMVGLWGNVWQWMDGARTLSSVIERRTYNGGWVSTGEAVPNGGGTQYPITFRATGDESWVADTYSTSNDNTATLPDYRRWRDAGEYYPYVGGSWGVGALAGLWAVVCNSSASYSYSNIGARLARVV